MKHLIFLCLLLISTSAFSKIWRVNNKPGVAADFTTAQLAHDGAAAGDTIMFEPSATNYGNMTITKQLVIFGVGYFHAQNFPNSPVTTTSALTTVTFSAGSSGSSISGIEHTGNMEVNTSNITIKGVARLTGSSEINLNSATNIVIARCYGVSPDLTGTCSNILITNSMLNGLDVPAGHAGVVISYCIFNYSLNVVSQTLNNNILLYPSNPTLTSNAMSNNIDARVSPGTAFGTSNGNFGSVLPSVIFEGVTVNSGNYYFTYDGDLKLKATTSPAIGAGVGGTDCGIYGGTGPYVPSGLPPIPMLTKLVSTGIGSDTTPVQITISAKSNN